MEQENKNQTAAQADTAPAQPEETAAETAADQTETGAQDAQAPDAAAQAAAAKARAEELEKQLAETKDALLRTAAEYDNFRKRSAREHDAAFGNGVSHAVNLLLPVLDTLSYAANAATEDENYKKGVLMTVA